jgi:hypothetical protein
MTSFYVCLIAVCFSTKLVRAPLVTVPLALLASVMIVRHMRGAGVELDDQGRVVRGLRTKRIAWTHDRAARVTRGTSVLPMQWRVPCFELDDGTIVRADEIRSLRVGTIVDTVVSGTLKHIEQ